MKPTIKTLQAVIDDLEATRERLVKERNTLADEKMTLLHDRFKLQARIDALEWALVLAQNVCRNVYKDKLRLAE